MGRFAVSFLERELAACPSEPRQDTVQDKFGPAIMANFAEIISRLHDENQALKIRFLTDIQSENLEYVKKLVEAEAIDVRHLGGIQAKFAVTSIEYLTTTRSLESGLPDELIWGKTRELVGQMRNIFQNLWDSAIPAKTRIREIEQKIEHGEDRVIYDPKEVEELGRRLTRECKKEMLFIVASEATIRRYHKLIQGDVSHFAEKGVSYRMLAPVKDPKVAELLKGINWRKIEPLNLGYVIFDREKMLITQYGLESSDGFSRNESTAIIPVVVSNTYTTNLQTIHGIASIFENLWRQCDILDRVEKAKKQAQLLQDILSHDIKNYNQVSIMGAELLKEETKGNKSLEQLVDRVLQAINGSTQLIERANKLGKVLAESNPQLRPIKILDALEESISLVKRGNPTKDVEYTLSFSEAQDLGRTEIMAETDDLIHEVFTNIFANSIRYSDGDSVKIEVKISRLKEQVTPGERGDFWKVSIADHGKGIPPFIKEKVFSRYLEGARGTGLGMSIVHALVVDRYRGKVMITDRVQGDYSKGTVVEISIPALKI